MSEDTRTIIQGRAASSSNEAYVAQALTMAKFTYRYQVPLAGGTRERGGVVLDFLVYTPREQPVEVQGGIWHSGMLGQYDIFKLDLEERIYKVKPIEFFEEESNSLEAAQRAVREKLGRPG